MGVLTDIATAGMGGGDSSGSGSGLIGFLRKKKRGNAGANPTNSAGTSGDVQDSYHKGGRVKRTGSARLRKGEVVLTAKQARRKGVRGKRR
jgi:hypothetical protein